MKTILWGLLVTVVGCLNPLGALWMVLDAQDQDDEEEQDDE